MTGKRPHNVGLFQRSLLCLNGSQNFGIHEIFSVEFRLAQRDNVDILDKLLKSLCKIKPHLNEWTKISTIVQERRIDNF